MTRYAELLKASAARAFKASVTGIFLGGLAGGASLFLAGGVAPAVEFSARVSWGLLLLPLAALAGQVFKDLQSDDRSLYFRPASAYGLLVPAGLVSALLATLFFFSLAYNTIAFLNGADPASVLPALSARVGPLVGPLAALVTTAGAAGLAAWANRQAKANSLVS